METEDTHTLWEPLIKQKIKFSIFYTCFEEEMWKYFRRLVCQQKKNPHMHLPESICESTTGQANSPDHWGKEIEKKKKGNSLSFSHVENKNFVLKFVQIYFWTQSPTPHRK